MAQADRQSQSDPLMLIDFMLEILQLLTNPPSPPDNFNIPLQDVRRAGKNSVARGSNDLANPECCTAKSHPGRGTSGKISQTR